MSRNVLAEAGAGTEASAASLRVLLEDAEDLRTIPMFSRLIGSESMAVVTGERVTAAGTLRSLRLWLVWGGGKSTLFRGGGRFREELPLEVDPAA